MTFGLDPVLEGAEADQFNLLQIACQLVEVFQALCMAIFRRGVHCHCIQVLMDGYSGSKTTLTRIIESFGH